MIVVVYGQQFKALGKEKSVSRAWPSLYTYVWPSRGRAMKINLHLPRGPGKSVWLIFVAVLAVAFRNLCYCLFPFLCFFSNLAHSPVQSRFLVFGVLFLFSSWGLPLGTFLLASSWLVILVKEAILKWENDRCIHHLGNRLSFPPSFLSSTPSLLCPSLLSCRGHWMLVLGGLWHAAMTSAVY